jgi:hypothetical protein
MLNKFFTVGCRAKNGFDTVKVVVCNENKNGFLFDL